MIKSNNTKKITSKETGMTFDSIVATFKDVVAKTLTAGAPVMREALIAALQDLRGEDPVAEVAEKVATKKSAVQVATPVANPVEEVVAPQPEAAAAEEADAAIDAAAPVSEDSKARKLRLDKERRILQQTAKKEGWDEARLAKETAAWKAKNNIGEKSTPVDRAAEKAVVKEEVVAPPAAATKLAGKFAKKETPVATPPIKAIDKFKVGDVVLFADLSDGGEYKLKLTEIDAVNSLIKGIPAALDKSSEAPDVSGNDFSVFEASNDWSEVAADGHNIKGVAAQAATKSTKNKQA